eukprot:352749-Chlamydomonas_euryale.AAC.9
MPKPTVKLVSREGFEFVVDYKAACVSNTIRNMLSSQGVRRARRRARQQGQGFVCAASPAARPLTAPHAVWRRIAPRRGAEAGACHSTPLSGRNGGQHGSGRAGGGESLCCGKMHQEIPFVTTWPCAGPIRARSWMRERRRKRRERWIAFDGGHNMRGAWGGDSRQ